MTLKEVLDHLGVSYAPEGHDHHRAGWVNTDCIECNQPGHYRLGIHEHRLTAHCWVCGFFSLWKVLERLPQVSPIELRRVFPHLRRESFEAGQLSGGKTHVSGTYKPPKGVGPLLAAHKAYLKSRGFAPREIEDLWRVGGIGVAARLGWRLFIPVHDRAGNPVSWTTRSIGEGHSMRYLSASAAEEAVPHKSLLYGEELVPGHAVAVQEGPPDAWRVGPGAVATMGVSLTQEQVVKIAEYPLRLVCFDAEPAAQRRADRLCEELSAFAGETLNVRWESGKDASRSSMKEVIQLREVLR